MDVDHGLNIHACKNIGEHICENLNLEFVCLF